MADPADRDPVAAPVPDAAHLAALGADEWAAVLRHARAAMKDLDDELVTPRIQRLRAVPVSRLVDGRSRRDLCRELAEGGALWRETARGLASDASVDLEHLLSPAAARREPEPPDGAQERSATGDDERIHRLKERARQLLDERDDARRRATGLEARLRTEQDRIQELESELASVRAERDELRAEVEGAAEDRRESLERARRQHRAEVAELEDELRTYRRREQERQERQRRRHERQQRSAERTGEELAAHGEDTRRPRRAAEPGRPSTLPSGVAPGTTDAVESLLTRGRRVLIDGYNVTKQHRDHLPLEQQRDWLTQRVGSLARRTGVRPTIVFDGEAAAGHTARRSRKVAVVFTAGGTADDRIVRTVDDLPEDEPIVVVTDDGGLAERLRERGADVVGTVGFLGVLR